MKILAFANKTSSKYYRLTPQLDYLQKNGHEVIFREWNNKVEVKELIWADIVILEMLSAPKFVKTCKKYGCKVVIEFDDLVEIVPKLHPNYAKCHGWNAIKKYFQTIEDILLADAIIVTSPELYKRYGFWARKKLLFPNYCWLDHWEKPFYSNDSDVVRLLWAGSTSHKADLIPFKPVIKRVLEKYGNKVKFLYIGTGGASSDNPTTELFYGEDYFKDFSDNREYMIGVKGDTWPEKLSLIRADVAIAPLEKNYFNKCKSLCKYLEYSINKIPAVYSRWFYKDIVVDGMTGLLADTPDEWFEKICWLIDHEQERKMIGEVAYANVKNQFNIENYLEKWANFILSLKKICPKL